jgi:sugar lactone lactonase YvrE
MKKRLLIIAVFLSFVILLVSCGGHGGGTASATGIVTTLAGIAGNPGSLDATGTAATFHTPYGITTDGTSLFVADTGNNTIRKIDIASGLVSTLTGTAGVPGSTDGPLAVATFNLPCGITMDGTGTSLYVADTGNSTIRKIDIASGLVSTLTGTAGVPGSTDGTLAVARFNRPAGITVDGNTLFVADTGNNTIRIIDIPTGVVATFVGSAEISGPTDGTAGAALFNNPVGVANDGTFLYVADSGNSTIRKVVISSRAVTTLAGIAGTSGSTDATGVAARFYHPVGISLHSSILYVADTLNSTIRRVQ